jgi:type IV secretion system protein VirB8
MSQEEGLDRYWREAASWDADRTARLRKSERVAWWAAGGGWTCAVMGALALVSLMPLKRVEPFVVRVDNSTGIVDVVPEYAGQEPTEAVTRYLLSHYVTVCERFNFSTAESDYQECGAFNSTQRNQLWYQLWSRANPLSPLNLYKDGSTVRVRVVSVSFFKRANGESDIAQVRYVKAKRAAETGDSQLTHWIASVQYGYGEPSKDPRTRGWNPLGFRIVDFRPEPETATDAAADAVPPPPHGGPQ